MGVVSAYIANRATGEALPGLCVVRDVTQFQADVKRFKTVDEAKQEEQPIAPPSAPPVLKPSNELPPSASPG
jgi:hypothetical protein